MKKRLFLASSLLCLTSVAVPAIAVPTTPKPTVQTQTKALQSKIEVLSAGAQQSRQLLRYKPVANTKEIATMKMDMDMDFQVAGTRVPSPVPSSVIKMEITVNKVDPNGDIHYSIAYANVDVVQRADIPQNLLNAVRSQLKKLEGIRGTAVVDNRGQTKSLDLKLPNTLDANTKQTLTQLQQSLESLAVGLPAEPVGVGAKWRIAQPVQLSGIALKNIATYELVSLDQSGATIKVSIDQDGKTQRPTQLNTIPNATVNLKSIISTGQGNVVFRWDRVFPAQSSLSMKTKMEMDVSRTAQEKPMPIQMETRTELAIEGTSK